MVAVDVFEQFRRAINEPRQRTFLCEDIGNM